MATEVKVPVVGESVQEAMIQSWKKQSGDWIDRDQVLCELETDKATVEVVASVSGKLETLVSVGQVVKVGALIAKIDETANKSAQTPASSATPPAPKASQEAKASSSQSQSLGSPLDNGPSVRRIVTEQNISLENIQGSGRGGRVTKEDIILQTADKKPAETKAPATPETKATTVVIPGSREAIRKPMTMLRRRVAERLVNAQKTAAILTTFNEIDMTAVIELRKKYKDVFEKKYGLKLGFMGFFLKASVRALLEVPEVNAFIEGDETVYHNYCDIGVAVSTEKGLMVPVIRNVESMSIHDIEKEIARYADKARQNKISIDDLNGGTFTVSNGGVFGSLLSTPILNPPQSAILGMHKTEMRPIVTAEGKIEARPMMYVALSYDHRIIDGKEAVGFLVKVKEAIEDPSRLLLGV
jgi:2-oxoglutarate dehydrogenase E2 component (dihydrolipoamide succinyltransferase)